MELLIAVLPSVLILYYIYQKDVIAKEPPELLLRLFMWGVFIVWPASVLETIWWIRPDGSDWFSLLVLSFFNIALIEETLKFGIFFLLIWNKAPEFDECYDGIVYAVFISLGFATLENILYVANYGPQTGLVRALTAVPLHAVCAVVSGSYLSRAWFGASASRTRHLLLAWAYPVLIHGLYNYIIFLENAFLSATVFPLLVLFYYNLGLRNIRDLSGK